MLRYQTETLLSGCRVLLVEDAPDNRFLISRILELAGARVETARDGVEALERTDASAFDVVLMDLQMPRMDGFDALKHLKDKNYPRPVVALTAHSMLDDRIKTHDAGFAAHLTKPINSGELINCVLQWSQYHVLDSCPH